MRTSKPVATITYNTKPFLDEKLAELMRKKKIQYYIYIYHYKEEDEKKDHVHLYVEPNTLIDTMDLQNFLSEPDLSHPDKPLKPQKFVFCRNIDEWILYSEHFPPYLATKLEERQLVYSYEDFCTPDDDTFYDLYLHAHKGSEWAMRNSIIAQLRNPDVDNLSLIYNGSVPINMASQILAIERMSMGYGKLDRNGKETHTPKEKN